MRMPGFSAEASLYRLSDSHYMTLESAAQAERESVVPQYSPIGTSRLHIGGCRDFGQYRLCNACDEYGCDPVILPRKPGSAY